MIQTQEKPADRGADAAPLGCNQTVPDSYPGLPPIHPGEVLWASYMQPMGLSVDKVADAVEITSQALQAVIDGNRPMDPDLGRRLERYFGTEPHFWSRLQQEFDQETSSAG